MFSTTVLAANDPLKTLAETSLDLQYTHGDSETFDFRLFLPKPFDTRQKYPLILWLHGYGDSGNDNLSQLKHIDTTICRDGASSTYPFFILAPQRSKAPQQYWLTQVGKDGDDMLAIAMKILDRVKQTYPIDGHRIAAIGISDGGTACWELAARYGDEFAAICPLGAGGAEITPNKQLRVVPIWAFHATNDPDVSVSGVRSVISKLSSADGIVHLTETEDEQHNCWSTAFAQHDLLYWLLSQTRGQPSPPPGRYRPKVFAQLSWNQLAPRLVPIGIFGAIGFACYRYYRYWSAYRVVVLPEVFSEDTRS